MRRFTKPMKLLFIASLLGFCSTLADIHIDDYATAEEEGRSDACCVTCCPAHHLGPAASLFEITPVAKVDWTFPIIASPYSAGFIVSVFDPPRVS